MRLSLLSSSLLVLTGLVSWTACSSGSPTNMNAADDPGSHHPSDQGSGGTNGTGSVIGSGSGGGAVNGGMGGSGAGGQGPGQPGVTSARVKFSLKGVK